MTLDLWKRTYPVESWPQMERPLEIYQDLKKILTLLEKIDKKLGQPDCVDPEKEKYLRDVEDAIKRFKEYSTSKE